MPVYRPTVHYAYMPCDNAILSLYELHDAQLPAAAEAAESCRTRSPSGIDELGVLLMGHGLNGWWTGSQLDIHEARRLRAGAERDDAPGRRVACSAGWSS